MISNIKCIYCLGGLVNLLVSKNQELTDDITGPDLKGRMESFLSGEELPIHSSQTTAYAKYWNTNLFYYQEIIGSLERMCHSYCLIGSFKVSKNMNLCGINEYVWIRNNFEYYLQEKYILMLRINRWIDFLITRAKRRGMRDIEKKLAKLKSAIDRRIDKQGISRHKHVHDRHYESRRSTAIEAVIFLLRKNRRSYLKEIKALHMKEFKKEKREKMKNEVEELISHIDARFKPLGQHLKNLV